MAGGIINNQTASALTWIWLSIFRKVVQKMDLLREVAPFLVGMVIPPILMLVLQAKWQGWLKFLVTFAVALVIGVCTSAWAGELAAGMPDALIAVMIDTSLVFTGSQVAYRLAWRPLLQARLQPLATRQEQVKQVRE